MIRIPFIRNWLTRPPTAEEAARALSQAGHEARRMHVRAVAAVLWEDAAVGRISPLAPRSEVVAGARRVRA
jgi:hypothetical protein